MAQRLCFDERTRIEVMSEAGLSVAEMADRLGRCRSTVYRELGRGGGRDGYRAGRAHRRTGVDAARPKVHKLAGASGGNPSPRPCTLAGGPAFGFYAG